MIFVDTSALFAFLDRSDEFHQRARALMPHVLRSGAATHNYVVVETDALTRRRLGATPAQALHHDLLPALDLHWIDREMHAGAVAGLLAGRGRQESLVDHVSFAIMRRMGIQTVFAFDDDFVHQGFALVS